MLNSGWGMAIAFVFLLCGALRLARYNVLRQEEEKGDMFLGLPIPAAAVSLSQYVVFTEHAWETSRAGSVAVFVVLALAFLMVSRADYDTIPNFRSNALGDRLKQAYFIAAAALLVNPGTSKEFFFPVIVIYLLSGVYRRVTSIFSDEVTQHA